MCKHLVTISSSISKNDLVNIDEDADFADIDWKSAAEESGILTPMELIEILRLRLECEIRDDEQDFEATQDESYLNRIEENKQLLEQCKGWVEDELEVIPQ